MALFSKKKEDAVEAAETKAAPKKTKKASKKAAAGSSVFAHVLLAPVVTEKAYTLADAQGKYAFRVAPRATKAQVAKAVADTYGVEVVKVNMMIKKQQNTSFRGIAGKTKSQKKAIVTVAPGQKIDLFE